MVKPVKSRARDLGIAIGSYPPGRWNALTDVPGVRVGHTTVYSDEAGCARTGVTAIIPHEGNVFTHKCAAAVHIINGYGKAMGLAQVEELGCLETPILLTNTLNIGLVSDAVVSYTLQNNPDMRSVNTLVAECNDGRLNEIEKRFVREEHVLSALNNAKSGVVREGCVGGGTGMIAFGYKGGIGTASRQVQIEQKTYHVGVLVQANFGKQEHLVIDGVPVGKLLQKSQLGASGDGSIVLVVGTDAPFNARQLKRLARRAGIGLARTGSVATNGSGDFVIAFSNTFIHHNEQDGELKRANMSENGRNMTTFFEATVEAAEEAIINALFMAVDTKGREDTFVPALPIEQTLAIMKEYRYSFKY